jgi:hypothetical protein
MSGPEAKHSLKAIYSELETHESHGTYSYLPKPSGVRSLPVKWVLKCKYNLDGTVNRYKARLVALGFLQMIEIDCGDTYAHFPKYPTLRFLIAHCLAIKVTITHLDVTTTSLNADLEEEVWVSEPQGTVATPGKEFKLQKALYGLKEAPRA